MQYQPVFTLARVGAANKAPHPDVDARRQAADDAGQGFAAGHDGNPAVRLAGPARFLLPGVMFKQKPANGNARRRHPGFTASHHLTG